MPQNDLITANRFRDYRVQTHSNEEVGTVADVVLELVSGRVTHLLVASKAGLLSAEKLLLVPWAAFVPAYNEQLLTLKQAGQTLADFAEAPYDLTHRGLLAGTPAGKHGASGSFIA